MRDQGPNEKVTEVSGPGVVIRPARLEDAAALANLLRSNAWHRRFEVEPEDETARTVTRQFALCMASESHSIVVACRHARIVGYGTAHWLPYLFFSGPEGFVSELFVDAAEQGQGIGRRLLDELVEEARRRGCSRMQLINLRSRASYERGFYAKLGWRERQEAASFVLSLEP